jgi:hypothetical protein
VGGDMTGDRIVWDPEDYPKRERTRRARAEVWMLLAGTAQRWADDIAGQSGPGVRPFAKWGDDDPMVVLGHRYGLKPTELARLVESLANQLETRAMKTGYADAWID